MTDPSGGAPVDLETAESRVSIVPRRGGIVSRFEVGGERVLYMDESTLADPTKNVRGGIPMLFPTPGKLADDRWAFDGKSGALKQHGFARSETWEVISVSRERDRAVLRLTWAGNAEGWPWPTTLEVAFGLKKRRLRIDQKVQNAGKERMPFGLGIHPYFYVPEAEKKGARIATQASKAFDNVAKRIVDLPKGASSIDLASGEVDLHLIDHGTTASALTWGSQVTRVRGSAEYTRWVIWTLPGQEFVCLEPWTCPGNALNTGEGLLFVEPGATRAAWLEIEAA